MSFPPLNPLQKERTLQIVSMLFGVGLFILSIWVLHHKVSKLGYGNLLQSIQQIPARYVVLSLILSFADYFILSGHDSIGLAYIGRKLPYYRVLLTSFVSYTFGHNIGMPLLSGSSMRYRLYSGYGITMKDITKLIAISLLTCILGYLAVGGIVFLFFKPIHIPPIFGLPFLTVRPLGGALLISLILYLSWNFRHQNSASVLGFRLPKLRPSICVLQLIIGSLEIIVAAAALYVLLPVHLPFSMFLGIFILAQVAGLLSQVPGGIGVFESAFVLLLSSAMNINADVVASLLVYRVTYFLAPLAVAILLYGTYEWRRNGKRKKEQRQI